MNVNYLSLNKNTTTKNMKKQYYLIMALLTILNLNLSLNLISQVAVNTSGEAADGSAMLDVSSTDKGILIPRLTKAERDAITVSSERIGLLIYQTDNTPGFYFYNGSAWVVVGDGATSINSLYDGVSDGNSVFLGAGAGDNDDGTTNYNTGTGIFALKEVIGGDYNSAFGTEALRDLETGKYNVGFGRASLLQNIAGNYNVALGANAGYSLTGSGNILIGYNAGFDETAINNKLFIHNSHISTPLIYGEFDNSLLRINGTLDINNAYQLPTIDGTVGQTFKTDGSGILTWSDDGGATSLNDLSDAATDNNSLFLGVDAGGNDDGTTNFNTGTGVWSLKDVTSGSHNSAMGTTALQQLTTGTQNTAFGMGALNYVTTNSNNTAIGKEAGKKVTGSGNIFIGNEAAKTQAAISNKLFIDNSDTVAPLIYGDFENDLVRVNGDLEVTGSMGEIDNLSDGKTGGYSVFLGIDAGANDDGSYNNNTAIGHNALYTNTTGSYNNAVGINALKSNISGGDNNAIGDCALQNNTTGEGNTACGSMTLYSNIAGSYNTALGGYALEFNKTGNNNVAIGYDAFKGSSYNSGSYNTAIGSNSSRNNSGSNNTIIGYNAGRNGNFSGSVCIGYQAGYGSIVSNKLYIDNSDTEYPLIWGDFENNNATINGNLNVTGQFNLNGDQIEINNLSDAKTDGSNLFLGNLAGDSVSGYNYATAVGIGAMAINTTGDKNTALGSYSLNLNTTGSSNIAIGADALKNNTASDNTAVGSEAMLSNTTGHHNTSMGKSALDINTEGNDNTAIGADALGSNTTASNNTAIGKNALRVYTTGENNTAVGKHSLYYGTTGSNNTAVGADAGQSQTNDYSNTGAFGYYTLVSADGYYRIGNTTVSSIGGNVGWSTYSDGRFKQNINENIPGLDFILKLKPVSYNWDIHKLDDFIGATEGTESSEHMREARRQQEEKVYTGFVAQNVEKAAQEIGYDFSGVETPPNDGTPYSLRYAEFVVPLVKAVQELAGQNEEQQEIIDLLKQQNEMLMKRLDMLESE